MPSMTDESVQDGVVAGGLALGRTRARIEAVQDELGVLAGVLHAVEARMTVLVARGLAEDTWAQGGVLSPEHWVAWQCGLSPARSHQFTAAAKRLDELPVTMGRFGRGELSADQVAAIVKYAPAVKDAEVAEFAVMATVTQLRRTLAGYGWGPDKPDPDPRSPEERRCSFSSDDQGHWSLHASGPVDEGARIEATLKAIRQQLVDEAGDAEARRAVSWWDALLAMGDRAAQADTEKCLHRRKRHLVNIHLELDENGRLLASLHLGSTLERSIRRFQTCDSDIRVIWQVNGLPVSVGKQMHIVPDRTRLVVEHRDGGCRIPGCTGRRVEVHHIVHWEDDGPTDTHNLLCLCPRHHRLHHLGMLGITGNADDPDSLVFTDHWGRTITSAGPTHPPNVPPVQAAAAAGVHPTGYTHPLGERLQRKWVDFGPPAA
jgi:hypothetical protein